MSISELSRRTGLVRQTLSRYVKKGMPTTSVEDALHWIAKNKQAPETEAEVESAKYPRVQVDGDSPSARLQRLIDSEKYLSSSILGIQQVTLPQLEDLLEHAENKQEAKDIRKEMFKAQTVLTGLRKERLAVSKCIADIEHRKETAAGGRIPFGWVKDTLTSGLPPVMQITSKMDDQILAARIVGAFVAAIKGMIHTLSQAVPSGYEGEDTVNRPMISPDTELEALEFEAKLTPFMQKEDQI